MASGKRLNIGPLLTLQVSSVDANGRPAAATANVPTTPAITKSIWTGTREGGVVQARDAFEFFSKSGEACEVLGPKVTCSKSNKEKTGKYGMYENFFRADHEGGLIDSTGTGASSKQGNLVDFFENAGKQGVLSRGAKYELAGIELEIASRNENKSLETLLKHRGEFLKNGKLKWM